MIATLSEWVTRHAGWVVAGVVALTALAAASLVDWPERRLAIDIDPAIGTLLPAGGEAQAYLKRVERIFGQSESVVVALYPEDVFAAATLTSLAALDRDLAALPYVQSVTSLASAPLMRADGDTLDLGAASAGEGEALAQAARANPLIAGTLLGAEGRATALVVALAADYETDPGGQAAMAGIRAAVDAAFADTAGVRVTGPPAIKAATVEALMRELTRLVPGILVLVALFLLVAFRSARGVLLPMATIGIALVWVLAVMSLTGRSLNLITAIVPPVVITVGLAYTLHLLSAYYRVRRAADPAAAAVADVGMPLLLTGATTGSGFLALMLSPLAPIREFAWLSALGIGFSVLLSLTFLPAMLRLFACHNIGAPPGARLVRFGSSWLAAFNVRHRRRILAAGGVLMLVALVGASGIRVGTDYVNGFGESTPVRQDFNRISGDFGGATPLSVVLTAPAQGSFARPDLLAALDELQRWLAEQPEIGSVTSLVDYVRTLNRALNEGDAAAYAIPDNATAVKQLLLFGGGDTLESLADTGLRHTQLKVRANVSDSAAIGALVDRIRDRLATLPEPLSGRVTGTPVLLGNVVDDIASGQIVTIGAALLVVFLLLSALFTSFSTGALALLPNLLPVLLYFGALGFSGVTLNPTTSLIACIVLGIAVDDTLYYLARFNNDARRFASESRATVSALRAVLRPVTYTSLALIAGFLMLTTSGLQNQVQFGALAAFTIAVAWLTDVTFTPALASGVKIVTLWDVLRLDLGRAPQDSIPLFADLKLRQARIFALLSEIQQSPAGERVIAEGDEAGDIFVVIDGELRVWVEREDQQVELQRLRRGAVLGEVGHFARRRTANVDAVTDVRLLRFDSDDLEQLRRRYPRTAALVFRNLNRIQAQRLAEATRRIA
ncbi:MMPL family transporter [Salinisphaera sp. P385]|uniref:MMPL family transporter n=1 Tax=Spectribacter acetivorans TaxID=3075603 RepID=A0ABU3BAB8_9GAMM|nr:MMPL family transporter [Salinisphaera sp. P385]MDT0619421.1 MMPL family transporter [Salinisphaera sp. P385]